MDNLIDDIADEVESSFSIEYKDPYKRPYGDPERQTKSQKKVWTYLNDYNVWRQAMIGAKGSGKSHAGAAFSFHFGQKYPGAMGAVVANTDRQAKDAAGEHFVSMADSLGYDTEYFGSKKIDGQQYSKFYIVDLDGQGYETGLRFKLMVRALKSVDTMEGSEFDFMWMEETQDGERAPFVKAASRNRGTHIAGENVPNPIFIAGMTGGREHWMYDLIENDMAFQTEDQFEPEEFDPERRVEEGGVGGVLFEPVLTENKQNIGQSTIDKYYQMFDETKAERLIHANRVSKNQNRALYSYRDQIHTSGQMSDILCRYSPYKDLIISFDFNVSPMCVSAWQKKPWNDAWRRDNVQLVWDNTGTEIKEVRVWDEDTDRHPPTNDKVQDYESYDNLEAWKQPDDKALAQVDEWEVWPDDPMGGGTRGVMKHIVQDYASKHMASVTIVGDARGNDTNTSSSKTDWQIIREYASQFGETDIIPGLQSNRVTGEIKWSNPPVKDTLNNANSVLMNADGQARMCFMPESDYKSGGVSSSVSAVETGPNGKIDDKRDRSEERGKPRTHFLDTVRYVCWWFTEGAFMSVDAFEQALDELEQMEAEEEGIIVPEGEDPSRYAGFQDEEDDPMGYGSETDLMF